MIPVSAPPEGTESTMVSVSHQLEQQVIVSPVSVSITKVSTRKRIRESSPEESGKKRRCTRFPEPFVGTRPVVPITVKVDKSFVKTKALLDTGAQTFCLSSRFANAYSIEKVTCVNPRRMQSYSGDKAPGGEHYSEPIWFRLFGAAFQQPCEILMMESGFDMIIPSWWIQEVGLKLNVLPDGSGWMGKYACPTGSPAVGTSLPVTGKEEPFSYGMDRY